MFKRILVPLDGSGRAERALPIAMRLAAVPGGSILLVRIVPESDYAPAPLGVLDGKPDPTSEAEAYLKAVASRADLAETSVDTLVMIGPPATEILDAIRNTSVDAIVMCSHGRTGLAKWAMGSVAQKVARHGTVPVLVLKEDASVPQALSSQAARELRVLIPLDGSPLAEAAIAPALALVGALAAGGAAHVHLLRAVDLTSIYGRVGIDGDPDHTLRADITQSAERYLSDMADQVRGQMPASLLQGSVTWSVATGIDPAAIIVDTASGHAAQASDERAPEFDLVAMATHGRGGVGLWAVGSVTERMLTTSTLPLLIVRPPHGHGHADEAATVGTEPWSTPLF